LALSRSLWSAAPCAASSTTLSGAAIVGAKVSITNPSTGLKREVSTDADGGYTFEALNPGEFNLVVEAPGFATYNVKQIVVNVGVLSLWTFT